MDRENDFKPYLCGGTFFDLILQAKSSRRHTSIGKINNKKNRECDCLIALISIYHDIDGSYSESTIISNTSKYKKCKLDSQEWMGFSNNKLITEFISTHKNNYFLLYNKMVEFCVDFGLNNEMNWLTSALLDLISQDDSIADDDIFILGSDSSEYTKKQIIEMTSIPFEPLMLSIWYYIIVNRPDTYSEKGIQTYNTWHQPQANFDNYSRKSVPFSSDIGNKYLNVKVVSHAMAEHDSNGIFMGIFDYASSGISNNINKSLKKTAPNYEYNGFNFNLYKTSAIDKYGFVRTLLFKNKQIPFNNVYVCNDILSDSAPFKAFDNLNIPEQLDDYPELKSYYIQNADIYDFPLHRISIITGPGGIGKSMMMRHLLLSTLDYLTIHNEKADADNVEFAPSIPVLINLRDYNLTYSIFEDFIKHSLSLLCSVADIEYIINMMDIGAVTFLLDGLDELNNEYREHFEKSLSIFYQRYPNCQYIMSSRPMNYYFDTIRYDVFHLKPLSKKQALSLIDKLNFRPDQPNIKKSFYDKLDKSLYNTHREFVGNPLLLNIMLMTFEHYAEIPSRIHRFYSEAYNTLILSHDANKGAFIRKLKTELDTDQFSELMENFCAFSYQDNLITLTDNDVKRYLHDINKKHILPYIDSQSFIYDVTTNTCLMYQENGQYYFIHRSFQEYFFAVYCSKIKDIYYKSIGDYFESIGRRSNNDKSFEMFYDMVKWKVEEYIILPYMEKLLSECEKAENPYVYFITKLYPVLYYDIQSVGTIQKNEAISFLYNFINEQYRTIHNTISLPLYDEFVIEQYYERKKKLEDGSYDDIVYFIPESKIYNREDKQYKYSDECCGYNCKVSTSEIFDNPKYKEIKNHFLENDFPLHIEYESFKSLYESLKNKYQNNNNIDIFRIV